MFFYAQFFTTALDGIDRSNITGLTVQIGQVILLISFLVAVYESYVRGGDVRMLAVAGVKYLAVGLVLTGYATVFRETNGMFNQLANAIASFTTGGADIFQVWFSDLQTFYAEFGYQRFWDLFMGGVAAIIGLLPMLAGYLIYPLTYVAFCFLYSFYGAVLYVVGPIVISLIPAFGVGQLGRAYVVNLVIFHFWGIIYVILGGLMTAVNLATVADVLNSQSFVGGFVGLEQSALLGVASIFYSISIVAIPFLASRIVRGETFGTIANVVLSKLPLPLPRRG